MSTLRNIRDQFPIFSKRPELVYLDNAATSQKPKSVIDAMKDFYSNDNANVHRGLYDLSAAATRRYEDVRSKVATMIGATDKQQIAFTKGTTESINIVAQGFLRKRLRPGDQVMITGMEHHANLIPWQQVCKQQGANLVVLPVDQNGDLEIERLDKLLSSKTRFVALTHISNVLGTINPIDEIIDKAQKKKIPVLIDAAQSAGHYPVDVAKLGVDFFVFSAHKMFGPLGTGVLYSKSEHGNDIDPINFGGGAIKSVTLDETQFLDYPHRLEAGTPNVAGVLGLCAAIDFVAKIDYKDASSHTEALASQFKEKLAAIPDFHAVGNPKRQGPIVSFVSKKIHPHDIASFLGQANVAVRAGHHCAQPLMDSLNVPATVRASFSIYNTSEDVDKAIRALVDLKKILVMSKDLKKLYSEVIRKLNDDPYHFEKKPDAACQLHADNPVCGDRFDIFMDCVDDKISAVHFHGFGCAISKASTSMLVKAIDGKSKTEAEVICENFLRFINQDSRYEAVTLPSEHAAFSGVFEFPERIECATLAWKELKKFLMRRGEL